MSLRLIIVVALLDALVCGIDSERSYYESRKLMIGMPQDIGGGTSDRMDSSLSTPPLDTPPTFGVNYIPNDSSIRSFSTPPPPLDFLTSGVNFVPELGRRPCLSTPQPDDFPYPGFNLIPC